MDILNSLKNEVFKRRPVLKEIANSHSGQSLFAYLKDGWQAPKFKPDRLFLNCLEKSLAGVYGMELASRARAQLENKPIVSTVDHHGIWNHPIFVNSALIYSLYFQPHELVLILTTEGVSLNNASSWSGCLLEHSSTLALTRHSFFPDRLKTLPVLSAPAIGDSGFKKIRRGVSAKASELVSRLETDSVKNSKDFSSQACLMSAAVWQVVFPSAPKLVYFPLERLVSGYLLEAFEDSEHILTKLVATKLGQKSWQKYFFNEHTFLFWGIDSKGRRQSLANLPDNISAIRKLIEAKQIYPSTPLCFAVLLNAGLACAGGFTQTTWLSGVKEKLVQLFAEFALDVKIINSVPTKNFAESSLAWLGRGTLGSFQPTAVDLFLTGTDHYADFVALSKKFTLGQSLDLAMPTIYSVVVPKQQWLAGFEPQALAREIKKFFDEKQ